VEISVAFARPRQRGHERLGYIRDGDLAVAYDFRRGNRTTIEFAVCLVVACNGGVTVDAPAKTPPLARAIDDDLRAQAGTIQSLGNSSRGT
jgi:hypothetical protein